MSELSDAEDSTNKVPLLPRPDEVEGATTQHRRQMPAIPSILKRDDLASPGTKAAPAPAFSWPLTATKPREPGPWKPPTNPRPTPTSRPALGPAPRARSDSAAPRPLGKIEIPTLPRIIEKPVAATPIARVVPVPAPVVEARAPSVELPIVEAAPAPMRAPVIEPPVVEAPAVAAPPVVEEPASVAAESPAPVAAPASSTHSRRNKRGNVRRQRAAAPLESTAETVSEPISQAPAFGAGMLQSRSGRTKRPTPAPAMASAPVAEMPTTFGSGMLKSRGAKKATRDVSAPVAPVVAITTQPSFGAGMLQARKGRGKLVVGLIVAAAIAIGLGFALTGGSSHAAAAAATQKT